MSYDGVFPDGPYIIPTRDDLDRILSFDTIGTIAYHDLPVGSYYLLGGRYHYKAVDLRDPIKVPDIGDVKTINNFETEGVQEIAQNMAYTPVIHIKPTKWNGPSPDELAKMSRKQRNRALNELRNK